ncbi:hypothetical protein B0H10DRAFT_2209937 [Mycena sp. CBHHK59/15]|nr:hypothetical protein B0H10DRAFT_2209937 [Mycena sp. CBHHK59/15]
MCPADIAPLHNMELQEKNVKNLHVEKNNNASIMLMHVYEAAHATAAGVGNLNVGSALEPFFSYTDEEKALMVSSKELVDVVGPLPIFLIQHIAMECLKITRAEADEKVTCDKEAEKLKANQSIMGMLLMSNPHAISSVLSGPANIPPIFSVSLRHQVYFPLHWWTDKVLGEAVEFPHTVPKESICAAQTSVLVTPECMHVVNVAKVTKIFRGEEISSALSTSLWHQVSRNLLTAYQHLCPVVDPNNPSSPCHTYASEYNLHIVFFANLKVFNNLPVAL